MTDKSLKGLLANYGQSESTQMLPMPPRQRRMKRSKMKDKQIESYKRCWIYQRLGNRIDAGFYFVQFDLGWVFVSPVYDTIEQCRVAVDNRT
jgi:hypothetical protein